MNSTEHHIPENIPAEILHYINGQYVPSKSGKTFDVIDPVTGKPYTKCAWGLKEDVDAAVAAAKEAFDNGPWPRLKNRERAKILYRVADLIVERGDQLVEAEVFDTGLVLKQARGQAARSAENFRFFADLIVAGGSHSYAVPGSQMNYVYRKPKGVAGLITPWNTPFMQESWKLAPALASGCTVVLKPAEFTPLSATLWGQIFKDAGMPDGVFNLVNGLGETTGDALVKHPDVRVISFTGEAGTGRTIYANCAATLKGMSMELGGKSPAVVFADADLETAVRSTVFSVMSLNGERCTAGSRILVQRPIYEKFCEMYKARCESMVVGNPYDESSDVGALVHPEHYAKVMSYVGIGKQEATLLTGGSVPEDLPEEWKGGSFLRPTAFINVKPNARIFREEIFGPVVAITPFDTEEEALQLANDTEYGLASYVWTNDLKRAHRFAQRIEAGMVWLNSHNVRDLRMPFGGVKASGLGHEGGYRSLDVYTDQQAIHITLDEAKGSGFGG